jgi:hypothetical protein
MTPRWLTVLGPERALQLLPFLFGVALIGGMALQARLMQPHAIAFDLPTTSGILPGAAPQQSVAPEERLPPRAAPASVLPTDSRPPAPPLNTTEPEAGAAPGAVRVEPAATGAWADRLPRSIPAEGGAGNLNIKSKQQPTAMSALIASLMQSLKRLHPLTLQRAKPVANPLATKPLLHQARPALTASRPAPVRGTLGGAASLRAGLGGPAPMAARYAPAINGATVASRR